MFNSFDIETLARWNFYFQVAVVAGVVISGAAGILSLVATARLSVLQDENAESLQKRLDKAEKRLAGRLLDPNQEITFVELLRDRDRGPLIVKVPNGDQEAFDLAVQLVALLRRAGWQPMDPFVESSTGPPPTGIAVIVDDANNPPDRANNLLRALRAVGLDAKGQSTGALASDAVGLTVGHMPTR